MPVQNGEMVALALLSVAEVPNFFSGLLPSLWTIGHFSASENEEAKYWIRRGEVAATILSVSVGCTVAYLAASLWPLIGTIAMTVILLYLYEHALRSGSGASWDAQPATQD